MKPYKLTALVSLITVWIEYVVAASVVFLDPSYNDFPYTKIVLSWPGVIEEVHRLVALVIVLVFLINIIVVFTERKAPRGLKELSIVAFVLLILQASFGAITIWNYDYPPFVVLHEGNAGLLLLVTSFLAAYALYWGRDGLSETSRGTA
ncbi:MAG: COX15/CtaA family protein [Thermoplasmata archaeon]|nr:COX15/CtaA family protein [Candidatus Sysuiplasma jiujiangense]MBX8640527.1 COX15/CtaA family protein [Candidatus Sysuiplasma jiujiangense]MBX8641717.1 COX15/CtaA family protein [Candidatus Sysuiplasma jiujiangense]